jgi:outer membrane lipoprotein-sorting protein
MLNNPTNSICSSARLRVLTLLAVTLLVSRSLAQQPPPAPAGAPDGKGTASPTPTAGTPATPAATTATPAATTATPAATMAAQPEEPPTETDRFVDEAIAKIAKLQSVSADMLQSVDMLHLKFTVKGRYVRAPKSRFKLELTTEGLPDATGRSLQVCDGETLWDYQQILDRPYYRKLSIKPVLERLNSPDLDPRIKTQAVTQMGLAGPEVLLVGLRKSIKFDLKEEAELDGRKVWKIHGDWKNRQGLVGPDARPISPMGALPPYVPRDVTLFLGKDNSWPHKLILQGRAPTALIETRRIGPDGRPIGAKSSIEKIPRTLITLVYSNLKLDSTIPVDEFAFQAPANATVDDGTEDILKNLDRALELEAQKKKNEAAQKDGSVIDQPINLPSPPNAPNP